MNDRINDIAKIPTFSSMSQQEISKIAKYLQPVEFPEDQYILLQGKPSSGIYLLIEGEVEATVRLYGNKRLHLTTCSAPDLIGEIAFMEHAPITADIRTLTPLKTYCFSNSYIHTFQLTHPHISYKLSMQIAKRMCQRIRGISKIVMDDAEDTQDVSLPNILAPLKMLGKKHITEIDDDIKKYLNRLKFIQELSANELGILMAHCRLHKVKKGRPIYLEGEQSDSFFMVVLGAVLATLHLPKRISKLGVYGPGEIFGHTGFTDKQPHSTSTMAREDAVILEIDHQALDAIKKESVILWFKCHNLVFSAVAHMLRKVNRQYIQLEGLGKQIHHHEGDYNV